MLQDDSVIVLDELVMTQQNKELQCFNFEGVRKLITEETIKIGFSLSTN